METGGYHVTDSCWCVAFNKVSDRGSLVVRALAVHHQGTCLATHLNVNFLDPPTLLKNPIMTLKTVLGLAGLPGGYPKDEIDGIEAVKEFITTGTGYSQIQGTRPQVSGVAGLLNKYEQLIIGMFYRPWLWH